MECDIFTFALYMALPLLALMFGRWAQRAKVLVIVTPEKVYRPSKHINYFWYLNLFVVLFILLALRDVGTDLPVYKEIFQYSNTDYAESYGIEPGFLFLNRVLRFCTSNENVAILLFSFLSIYFVYKIIEYYADEIDLSLALFSFVSMFYFQSFSLLRIYLVTYFLCYTFKFMMNGDVKKYILCIFLSVLFHYSALLMLLPVLFYIIYRRSRKLFLLGIIFLLVGFSVSLQYLSLLNVFERYSTYAEGEVESGVGFGQVLNHLPLFLLYVYLRIKRYKSSVLDLFLVYSLFSFFYGMMGYKVFVIGRLSIYFIAIYVILIPWLMKLLKKDSDKMYYAIKISYIIYMFFRCYMYFKEYSLLDSIMPYKFIETL